MEQYCSIPLTYTDPLSDHYCSARRSLLLLLSSNGDRATVTHNDKLCLSLCVTLQHAVIARR